MNKLINVYSDLNSDQEIYKKYTNIGKNDYGNMFSFISTNSRGILPIRGNEYTGFYKAFKVILDVESIPRRDWERTNRVGQSFEKQHTVKMRESEFFLVKNDSYKLTKRGTVFKNAIDNTELSHYEKRLICYLLILSGYFSKTPNYVLVVTNSIIQSLEERKISKKTLKGEIKKIVEHYESGSAKKEDIFLFDYTYIDSFHKTHNGIDFLSLFMESTEKEKEEFKTTIYDNFKRKTKPFSILQKKYESGGNYTTTSLIDNAWILYVSIHLIEKYDENIRFDDFINEVLSAYSELFEINKSLLKKFIYDTSLNRTVLQVIFNSIYEKSNFGVVPFEDLTEEDIESFGRIDATDEEGDRQNRQVVATLKKVAKNKSKYKCLLEDLEDCKYFTSRESDTNYLEIHHLIPREFSNDFDESIEILANYIPLCPNCHRKIHNAKDRERTHMLNQLFNKRNTALATAGLKITLKQLYEYYRIVD